MNSIPSIFKKIHFSRINLINQKVVKKVFLAIVLVNYKKIDFKAYIDKIYELFKELSDDTYKIYFIDFSNKIDYESYFRNNYENIEIFLFKKRVDIINLLKFIYNEIESNFVFYINTDYELENIDIIENLKLFTDKNVGGITFGVYRGENYLQNYRYVFKRNGNLKKMYNIIEIEIAKEFSITLFPFDELFLIKRELIKLISRNYYKLFRFLLKKNRDDLVSKIELGLNFILNNFYFIINPYYHANYSGKVQLIDRIYLNNKEIFIDILNFIYFENPNIFKLLNIIERLLITGFSFKEILRFKKLFVTKKILECSKNIDKPQYLEKLISIFEKY